MILDEAIKRCKSEQYEFPAVIDSNAGLIEILELNVIGIPTWNRFNKTKKRKIVLEITSYRGISSNAVHYYGKLVVDGVYQATLDDVEKPRNLSSEQEKKNPLLRYKYIFTIKRPLSNNEIESDPQRWEGYDEGDMTNRYETTAELINDVIEILKLRFTGEWEFTVQYPRGNRETLNFQ
jgi:hypothetical protein